MKVGAEQVASLDVHLSEKNRKTVQNAQLLELAAQNRLIFDVQEQCDNKAQENTRRHTQSAIQSATH